MSYIYSKLIFSENIIIDGITWNKQSYQQINTELLPTCLIINHRYIRLLKSGDFCTKIISEIRIHPWQEKRKGFLIAASYQNGKYFHVLKQIVSFL